MPEPLTKLGWAKSSSAVSAPSWIVDQDKRLAALADSGIMDTAPEEAFDKIVLLATQACETPVALISLVADNRQWFKARIGFAACETALNQSVCKYVLDQSSLLVIPDLATDPRTSENALVTAGPRIRFYAGVKIKAVDGTPIGSLCVIDTKPRRSGLTPVQAAALKGLAFECSSLIASGAKRI